MSVLSLKGSAYQKAANKVIHMRMYKRSCTSSKRVPMCYKSAKSSHYVCGSYCSSVTL